MTHSMTPALGAHESGLQVGAQRARWDLLGHVELEDIVVSPPAMCRLRGKLQERADQTHSNAVWV